MCCAGIIGAHGDKGYCYSRTWKDAGVSFEHGMLLYMLTYTDVMDRPEHESDQWVIEKYDEYLPIIQEVEEELQD